MAKFPRADLYLIRVFGLKTCKIVRMIGFLKNKGWISLKVLIICVIRDSNPDISCYCKLIMPQQHQRMTEPASNVASCSGTAMEKSSSPPSEIAIGIDIGTSPCCVSVWNGSHYGKFMLHQSLNIYFGAFVETVYQHEFDCKKARKDSLPWWSIMKRKYLR
ncbi:uncharacterized protein LOC123900010 isoform X2 [Trifolium pratense]|uniref:uncharacterized protein LOC123900010 isoform X2 n=1 Tax=Trifolium pratense TaxID=57577 RepID=UPI001E692A36|nr:uncharacterized protein LOC123900010 isoform X2 [Trifolium pratense]